jgi:hypothetical protein
MPAHERQDLDPASIKLVRSGPPFVMHVALKRSIPNLSRNFVVTPARSLVIGDRGQREEIRGRGF